MILNVCNDDAQLIALATQQALTQPGTFGPYVLLSTWPGEVLADGENLFVIGHGSASDAVDGGNPVIGNKAGALIYNAVELWEAVLGTVLPDPVNWRGGVYLSACDAANPNRALSLSFGELLRTQVEVSSPGASGVWASRGGIAGPIEPPDERSWVRA